MSWLATFTLAVLHSLYHLILVFKSLGFRYRGSPLPLAALRSKLPSHLALALVEDSIKDEEAAEKYMLNTVDRCAEWCRAVGIRRLTVYDREGVLANCSLDIRERLLPPAEGNDTSDSSTECEIQYPLTPPPSDDADSRPLSPHASPPVPKLSVTTLRIPTNSPPKSKRRASVSRTNVKRRRVPRNSEKPEEPPFTLHIVSFKSGKPALAAAATTLLSELSDSSSNGAAPRITIGPSIQELNALLEGEYGFPSPDLMIVHRKPPVGQLRSPVELHGFPPWQMRLTEIYWEPYAVAKPRWSWGSRESSLPHIEEVEFRRALDEFAAAEMRVGK